MMRRALPLSLFISAAIGVGCLNQGGGGGGGNPDGAVADLSVGTMIPPPPMLGMQIDRVGRAGVSTALINPFELEPAPATTDSEHDAYNADGDEASWIGSWSGKIGKSLGIYDALDTDCGNQLGSPMGNDGGMRYGSLANLLADDQLFVNTGSSTCAQYLAVEAAATGAAALAGDCGGRTPSYDVIDVTYSALVGGTFSGVSDGIAQTAPLADPATFPFLAAPQ